MKRITLLVLSIAVSASAQELAHDSIQTLKTKVKVSVIDRLEALEKDELKFSRKAKRRPVTRQVRIDPVRSEVDSSGNSFVRFSVDSPQRTHTYKREKTFWKEHDLVGCIYLNTHQIFVIRNNEAFDSVWLSNKKTPPASRGTCGTGQKI